MNLLIILFIPIPGGSELILIFAIILLLFGGKKIPQFLKGLGQGIREYKSEMKQKKEDKLSKKESE